jgi:hypothetical protein
MIQITETNPASGQVVISEVEASVSTCKAAEIIHQAAGTPKCTADA